MPPGLPGPQPDLGLFVNIQEDPREIGKAEADWVIADSNGKANVVVLSHNEYAIAKVKSMATKDEIEKCPGCKVLDYVNSPASEAAQRQPQLTTSWVQSFGLPLYATSVGDNDLDFAVPTLRRGGVDPLRSSSSAPTAIVRPTTASARAISIRPSRCRSRSNCRPGRRSTN